MATAVLPIPQPSRGDWLRAEPFRAHLRHLMAATGLPWRVLSRLAGADPREVQRLLQGSSDGRTVRRVRIGLARKLFALDVETVDRARRRTVRSAVALEALTWLIEDGWTVTELSGRLQLSAGLLRALLDGRRAICSQLVAVQLLVAAEAVGYGVEEEGDNDEPQRQAA